MKPVTINKNSVKTQGVKQTTSFGIKSSGLHHILGILRNQLYSDKVLAVIREYTCNGVDAHTQAGCGERPIEVSFPNRMSPLFKVRDFGEALTDDDIQNVYAFYGESTKRNTNDQIGMLGIGSKAAFAYGDNFVINSFIDGKKHVYNAFIDPTQVGQISKLNVEDTDEENGIEIVVPVKDSDSDEFCKKGKALFEWYKVRPIVKGTGDFKYDDDKVLFSGEGWEWRDSRSDRYNRGDAMVVMGNIGYPIDEYALNLLHEDDYQQLLVENLLITSKIGDLEISASREKLQYTDHTKKSLKGILRRVQKEIAKQIGKQFGECKTLFDAKCLYGAVFQTTSPLYALKDSIAKYLTWNGEKIDGATFTCYNTTGVNLLNYKKAYRSGRYTGQEQNTIHCDKDVVVILNDVGHRRGSMGKILPLIHNKDKKVYLLEFKSYQEHNTNKNVTAKAVEKAWYKESNFDGAMLKLSELPQHKLSEFDGYQKSAGGSSYSPNKKHSAKCFEYDFDGKLDRWNNKKSDWWKVADLDIENDSGVYVIIDKFQMEKPKSGCAHFVDPRNVKQLKEVIEQAGVKFPKNLYAFKVGQRDKIEGKDGWTELHTWAKKELENIISNQKLNQAWIDIQKVDELNQWTEKGDRWNSTRVEEVITSLKKLKLVDNNGVMATFRAKHDEMKQDKKTHGRIKAIQSVAKDFGVDFTSPKGVKHTYDIKKMYQDVLKKYSMLALVNRESYGYNWDADKCDTVSNYVNVIDVCDVAKSSTG